MVYGLFLVRDAVPSCIALSSSGFTVQAEISCYLSAALDGLGMWLVWGTRGGRIGSWWGNRRERDRWGDLGVDGWIILGWICRKWVVGMWTGLG